MFTNKSIIQIEDKENKRELTNRNIVPGTASNTNILKRSKTTDPSKVLLK